MNLSELRELVMDREAWRAAIHGVTKNWTRLSDWTELNWTPGGLPNLGIEPTSPVSPGLAGWFFTTKPLGKPHSHMSTGKTTTLTLWTFVGKWYLCFLIHCLVCHNVPSKEQVSFNFMAAFTICNDFGAPENKICHYFHFFPFYLSWSDDTGCLDLHFLNAEF